MKKWIFIGILIALLLGTSLILGARLKHMQEERDRYKSNTETLLVEAETYRTRDSLNAITVGSLELKLNEFKQHRAENWALIKTLQTKNRDLERINTAQLQTIYSITGQIKDSIVYRDNIILDTLRCIKIHDPWFDLEGCIEKPDRFTGTFISRDSLLYVETVQYKRFLGFLWKTKRIKSRKQDIVSKNPNTRILDAEFITITK